MTWFCGQETPGNMKMLKEKKKEYCKLWPKNVNSLLFAPLLQRQS